MTKVNFVFPHGTENMGGAERMTLQAINKLNGEVLSTTSKIPEDDKDIYVFINRDYDKIIKLLKNDKDVILIGYFSLYHTFHNVYQNVSQIEVIRQLKEMCSYKKFTFVCMTHNDLEIANLLGFNDSVALGVNELPEVESGGYYDPDGDLLFVGRLSEQKDPIQLKKIAARLPEKTIRVTDCKDTDEHWYYDYAHKELDGIPNIKFVDPGSSKDYHQSFWKGVSCLIMTSRYETSPLVIFEALSKGIPVVCYDTVVPDTERFRYIANIFPGYDKDFVYQIDKLITLAKSSRVTVKEAYKVDRKVYLYESTTVSEAIQNIIAAIKYRCDGICASS